MSDLATVLERGISPFVSRLGRGSPLETCAFNSKAPVEEIPALSVWVASLVDLSVVAEDRPCGVGDVDSVDVVVALRRLVDVIEEASSCVLLCVTLELAVL